MLCILASLSELDPNPAQECLSSGRRMKTSNHDMYQENSENRQDRGPCHGSRSKGKGTKFYLSRDGIYSLNGTDT